MKILRADNLSKSYGEKILLNNVSFLIKEKDRIGLIGINGTGKSTLMSILAEKDNAENGEIDHPHDYQIGYLSQQTELDNDATVIDVVFDSQSPIMRAVKSYEKALADLASDGANPQFQAAYTKAEERMNQEDAWIADTNAKTILSKLGILFLDKRVSELSGGQKKRLGLAQVLIQEPDLLLLDEPTNHLDYQSIAWLENYLKQYKGALVVTTHDRYFLDRVTNRILELSHGNLYEYQGNYEVYLNQRAEREEIEEKQIHKNKQLYKQELIWMRAGVQGRGTKQQARINRFNDLKESVNNQQGTDDLSFSVATQRLGKKVIDVKHAYYKIDNKIILNDFSMLVQSRERLGITGENGSGKSTLLNLISGRLTIDSGVIDVGETVKIGYYTQENEQMDESKRMIQYLQEKAEQVKQNDGTTISVTEMLERFLFPRHMHGALISKLSGGEKRRLYLLNILIQHPNVLLLDEPTNDLDIETLTILEDYLETFPGAVITVSHDRYFLDKTMDKLLIFKGSGVIKVFYGLMSDYLLSDTEEVVESSETREWQDIEPPVEVKKEKNKLTYKEQQEWKTIETDIDSLEDVIAEINDTMVKFSNDAGKLQDLQKELSLKEHQLDQMIERWEYLSEFADS
ncbi:ABC-F family ATP-binding cassette domain-containing protein [Vagococcus vulneris]|uniref:Multidrug ABC transporter ATP-binding protein n=1 Tax=Vagococcus vulneris TaxID=1977869 RepID=A0A429ZZ79_9ENTE|nr:ABC-F family ATP-binding cassette domain-containing protein [Vagococcus vulneris]RST99315.1 multidrug ABC transporter ATP-binding protein [Vagococcus vulneris]